MALDHRSLRWFAACLRRPAARDLPSSRAHIAWRTIIGEHAEASWRHYLWGLWWSGLRLTESMELYWDRLDKLSFDFAGEFPLLRVPDHMDKGKITRCVPLAREFAEFLLGTPLEKRCGAIFNPKAKRVGEPRLQPQRVGEMVREIGRATGIVVGYSVWASRSIRVPTICAGRSRTVGQTASCLRSYSR